MATSIIKSNINQVSKKNISLTLFVKNSYYTKTLIWQGIVYMK